MKLKPGVKQSYKILIKYPPLIERVVTRRLKLAKLPTDIYALTSPKYLLFKKDRSLINCIINDIVYFKWEISIKIDLVIIFGKKKKIPYISFSC